MNERVQYNSAVNQPVNIIQILGFKSLFKGSVHVIENKALNLCSTAQGATRREGRTEFRPPSAYFAPPPHLWIIFNQILSIKKNTKISNYFLVFDLMKVLIYPLKKLYLCYYSTYTI